MNDKRKGIFSRALNILDKPSTAAILSIVFITLGTVLELYGYDQWLSRAGGCNVFLGVLVGLGSYKSFLEDIDKGVKRRSKQKPAIKNIVINKFKSVQEIDKERKNLLKKLDSIKLCEYWLLGVGTLFWTFGDLVPPPYCRYK